MNQKNKNNIFIIHFQPLELYPPAMNIIDFLGKNLQEQLVIVTNKNSKFNNLNEYNCLSENVRILRATNQAQSAFERYVNYFLFYLRTLFYLIKYQPNKVFYFETLSSWPALIYKKIKKHKVQLMVHYHEYTELELYAKEMKLAGFMHGMESKMYRNFSWISHTNPVRLQMFKDEHQLNSMNPNIFHVIPNYPSRSWIANSLNSKKTGVKKMVFVGSLGYDNMYLQEVINWIGDHNDEFSLDVYSYNIDDKAKEVLENNSHKNIRYYGGCDYHSLPGILVQYDIGLDIYKPFALNHVHGVSNKVFEYLACGLDVWFSIDKNFTLKYARNNIYPKVVPINFKQLSSFDYKSAISREDSAYGPSNFFYEDIYPEILKHINNDTNDIDL